MSGWLPPGCTDKDIDDAAPQSEPDDEFGEGWKVGADAFSAHYYLVDCLIKRWGAIDEAEEIIAKAREAIDAK